LANLRKQRLEEERQLRLAEIERLIATGELTIRPMTAQERERWPKRTPAAQPKPRARSI
jgi:hypothetical protein